MVRMIAILTACGLVVALVIGFASRSSVQVTYFGGGVPSYDDSNFEDCGVGSTNSDCYAYLDPDSNESMQCDYIVGFRAGDTKVSRLRVKLALMREGKVIDRDSIRIESLERPDDDPYVTKTIRGECDARQIRITEARAYVAGEETDLIASGTIGTKSLIPLFPDFFIKIGPAES